MSEPDAAPRRKLSSKASLILGIALLGGVSLLSAVQGWAVIAFAPGAAAVQTLDVTGQSLNSALTLIALAALASALVLTIAGRIFRRVIGALVVVLGAGTSVIGVQGWIAPLDQASRRIAEVTGIAGEAQAPLVESVQVSFWPLVTVAAGALLAVLGGAVVVLGGRWKAAGRKYDGETAAPAREETSSSPNNDRISDWDALSGGDDPTASDP